MSNYKDSIKNYVSMHGNAEKLMWEEVCNVEWLLSELKAEKNKLYLEFLKRSHEIKYGKHFDKSLSMELVSNMFHKENGDDVTGECVKLNEAKQYYINHKSKLHNDVTVYDFYVALNAYYHDNFNLLKRWFDSVDMNKIVEGTIEQWFNDEDANPDKLWLYMWSIPQY